MQDPSQQVGPDAADNGSICKHSEVLQCNPNFEEELNLDHVEQTEIMKNRRLREDVAMPTSLASMSEL